MLVLARQTGEVINIFTPEGIPLIAIEVIQISGGTVRLGIDAPRNYPIHRSEHGKPYLKEGKETA